MSSVVGIGELLYINRCVPQDRYQESHFLIGRYEVKVGGFLYCCSLGITRAAADIKRSCRAACPDGGLWASLFLKREGYLLCSQRKLAQWDWFIKHWGGGLISFLAGKPLAGST